MLRVVADLGNTRLKLGISRAGDELLTASFPASAPETWVLPGGVTASEASTARCVVSTVNGSAATRLEAFLRNNRLPEAVWFRTAADVPIHKRVEQPESAGPDRALGVLGAIACGIAGPGIVVSCGSAITADLVSGDGVWEGGAIAPGLRVGAEALSRLSPRLPLIEFGPTPPSPLGRSTRPALSAGVYWSAVGGVSELARRLAAMLSSEPWIVWTGGDASFIREGCNLTFGSMRSEPNLVLLGLLAASNLTEPPP